MTFLIRAAMCAVYPRTEHLPGVADADLDGFLRRYRREASALLWAGLVLGAVVFTITPLFTVGWPLPSLLLPRRVLDRHAERVMGHRVYLLRQSVFLLKMVAGLCWGSHPAVRKIWALPPYPADPGTWRAE